MHTTVVLNQWLSFLPLVMFSTNRISYGYHSNVKLVNSGRRRQGVLNFLPIFSVK